jgi:hypothetical protein
VTNVIASHVGSEVRICVTKRIMDDISQVGNVFAEGSTNGLESAGFGCIATNATVGHGAGVCTLVYSLSFFEFCFKNAEGLRADYDRPGHFFACRLSHEERRRAVDLQRRRDLLVILNF